MPLGIEPDRVSADEAEQMLGALREAHENVVAAILDMDEVTGARSEQLHYTRARFHISRASMARRQLFRAICAKLDGQLDGEEADALAAALAADNELLTHSSAHIRRWVPAAIERDWPGYCAASRVVREHMKRELDCEKRLLFPILEGLKRPAPSRAWAA
jgi:hypothetical protein